MNGEGVNLVSWRLRQWGTSIHTLLARSGDFTKNHCDVGEDTIIAEAKHGQIMCSKVFIAHCVILALFQVNFTIDFHHDTGIETTEIDDETTDDLLTAKMQASELMMTQFSPQHHFRRRHFLPELSRLPAIGTAQRLSRGDVSQSHANDIIA